MKINWLWCLWIQTHAHTHTWQKCEDVMTVPVCSMRCGPTWFTFNLGKRARETVYFHVPHGQHSAVDQKHPCHSREEYIMDLQLPVRFFFLNLFNTARSSLQIQNSLYPCVIEPARSHLCCTTGDLIRRYVESKGTQQHVLISALSCRWNTQRPHDSSPCHY